MIKIADSGTKRHTTARHDTDKRERLVPILKTVIKLGQQNIPFRGAHDDGQLLLVISHRRINLKNELIECCGEEIVNTIVKKMHDAGEYSIIFDKTADVSHRSQLSLSIQYVSKEGDAEEVDDEPFFEPKISGIDQGKIVVKAITNKGFDPLLCVGIASDGCSMITSDTSGAVSETSKIERHEAVLQFREGHFKIIQCLHRISQWSEIQASAKAKCLLAAISTDEFVITITTVSSKLETALSLSRLLQKKSLHLKDAANMLNHTMNILTGKRNSANEAFHELFVEAIELCDSLDIPIKIPRTSERQDHRCNIKTPPPENFYRILVFIRLLDNVLEDLHSRFPADTMDLYKLAVAIPSNGTKRVTNKEKKRNDSCTCSLQHLKTWIRSRMGQQRLTGMALLHVHRNIYIDPHQVITRLAEKRTRRQELRVSSKSIIYAPADTEGRHEEPALRMRQRTAGNVTVITSARRDAKRFTRPPHSERVTEDALVYLRNSGVFMYKIQRRRDRLVEEKGRIA
ncbi:hypothetical protein PR048_024988 [Dryococelus australis]|uniref:DUF4371 domain-containing protein n=1 Tax=Dryococelus australis TaxID=614101 RepID=A0ABQ9GQ70_9NEOP|nr:hypothetical protein PR048_024988 [Dryococelus australis]